MAEDDPAASGKGGDGREQPVAKALVGHEPERGEPGVRLPGHGNRL
jgi:hypothetical protein